MSALMVGDLPAGHGLRAEVGSPGMGGFGVNNPVPHPHLAVRVRRDLGVLSGTLAETSRLTVLTIEINPGETYAWHAHAGDELLYVIDGRLWVSEAQDDTTYVFELGQNDACLLPAGCDHEYRNYGAMPTRTLVGIAPTPGG